MLHLQIITWYRIVAPVLFLEQNTRQKAWPGRYNKIED
jgi:hypothetical protein